MATAVVTERVTCSDVSRDGVDIQLREIVAGNGLPSTTGTLVIFFGFVNQSTKVINRFCNIYHERGFNVLFVPGYLKYVTWPRNSINLAHVLLKYLEVNASSYRNLFIHAMSIGGYFFAVTMETVRTESTKYDNILPKVRGVVYDSVSIGTLKHLSRGAGKSLSKNRIIQNGVKASIFMYFNILALLDRTATESFRNSRRNFRLRPLDVPTLLFHSRDDYSCDNQLLDDMLEKWRESMSSAVVTKFWQTSKHAAHLHVHADEYLQTLKRFLDDIPQLAGERDPLSKL